MITFTRRTDVYDEVNDRMTPSTLSITGSAIETAGDPLRYRELGLIETEAPTLLFAPTTYGLAPALNTPAEGDETDWRGETWTVRSVRRVAPDGFTIVAKVIIAR